MKKLFMLLWPAVLVFALGTCKQASTTDKTEPVVHKEEVPHPGEAPYLRYCLSCHQSDGNGVPGMHPSLVKTEWILGDKEELIALVLNGLSGPIEVNGEQFNSIMAPMDFINDEDLANILSYIRSSFGNDASEITAEEVARVRAEVLE